MRIPGMSPNIMMGLSKISHLHTIMILILTILIGKVRHPFQRGEAQIGPLDLILRAWSQQLIIGLAHVGKLSLSLQEEGMEGIPHSKQTGQTPQDCFRGTVGSYILEDCHPEAGLLNSHHHQGF